MGSGVRDEYAQHPEGATGWYRDHGPTYRNPHEPAVQALIAREFASGALDPSGRFLDLACGSGEVSDALMQNGVALDRILACDPFTGVAYEARLGRRPHAWSFRDLALREVDDFSVDVVVCSFALHLCERSWLPELCRVLSERSESLLVLTPHKRPEIDDRWGWSLTDEQRDAEFRVRVRRYSSTTSLQRRPTPTTATER